MRRRLEIRHNFIVLGKQGAFNEKKTWICQQQQFKQFCHSELE